MNTIYTVLIYLIIILTIFTVDRSEAQRVMSIFSEVTEPSFQEKGQLERTYLNIDFDLLLNQHIEKGDLLSLEIDGEVVHTEVIRTESYVPGTYSYIAKNADLDALFIFTATKDQRFMGKLHLNGSRLIHFDYDVEQKSVYRHDVSHGSLDVFGCGVDEMEEIPVFDQADFEVHRKSSEVERNKPHTGAIAANLDDEITIDLMIVYSRAAVSWSSISSFGSIEGVIAQSMALSQGALDNSDVGVRLRLVHSAQVEYEEAVNGENGEPLLRKLTASPTFSLGSDFDNSMDEVHTLRDQYGADIVAGYFQYINDVGGIAWRLSNPAGFPQFGFSVNRVQQIATGYTLIHEIGHNVGIAHARNQQASGAAAVGGLFEYSVGYRTGSGFEGFNTIMAYAEGIENEAPLFSSPDLTFLDAPAGSPVDDFVSGYTDARRNWREIKSVIASYRPTRVDPPALTFTQNEIQVTLDREAQSTVPVTIQNTGASDLMWSLNFGIPSSTILAKSTRDNGSKIAEKSLPFSISTPGATQMPISDENGVILSEDFDDFFVGVQSVQKEWRMSSDNMKYEVLTQNPSQGSRHIRISRRSAVDGTMFFRSPYFGRQPFGDLDISLDVSFGHATERGSWDRFDIYFYDVLTGNLSAGLVFGEDGTLFTFNESSGNFGGTNFVYNPNTYYRLRVYFNADAGVVEYYMNNQKISERALTEKKSIDYMNILHFNEVEGSYIDIDNFEFKRTKLLNWLDVDRYAGVVKPGESGSFNLDFNTQAIPSGEYSLTMYLDSNDPVQPTLVIPIQLNVTTTVSVDEADLLPNQVSLRQNYPNPFNPTTSISYELPTAESVRLEIFDLLGRSVSVLVDERVEAGSHTVRFDASMLSSGMYLYRLAAGGQTITRQMILIR